jgi:DNA sulfur modification protein DndB
VLDGQHRLFSMAYTEQDYYFVVAIYDQLSTQDEVQLFIDINTNQKGVPPALLLDIKHLAGTETDIETQLRRLFDDVATDRHSPLLGQMSPSATRSGYVSRVSFNAALKKRLEAGPLANLRSTEDQARLVINYLIAADRVLVTSGAVNNKLNKATVLQAFFEIFDEVVNLTLERAHSLKPDDLTETMIPLSRVPFDMYIGSNRPSKAKLVADMRAALLPTSSVTSDML